MYGRTAILVHGYGVRSFFWDALRNELSRVFDRIKAPDFAIDDIQDGVRSLMSQCRTARESSSGAVTLIGHSLGGVLAALASRDLDTDIVSHAVLIASPYGEPVGRAFGPILRIRFALRLVGQREMRRRFFGPRVGEETQRRIFSSAVDESAQLKGLARKRRWFHTDAFPAGLAQHTLAIASEADRVVDYRETVEFAHAASARTIIYPASDAVGHNDFGVEPAIARRCAEDIARFIDATP